MNACCSTSTLASSPKQSERRGENIVVTHIPTLIRRLADAGVEFVIVGGVAATFHGSTLVTYDLDICIRFDLETMRRVVNALAELEPVERMNPSHPPMKADATAYVGYRNLYLKTNGGILDLLGEITGVGDFAAVREGAVEIDLQGARALVISAPKLIVAKKAVGRTKDLRVVTELELLEAERKA